MAKGIKKRRSIHPDVNPTDKREDEEVTARQSSQCQEEFRQCAKCCEILQITKDGLKLKITKEDLNELCKNQQGLYPILHESSSFVCDKCSAVHASNPIWIIIWVVAVIIGVIAVCVIKTFNDDDSPQDIVIPFDVKLSKQAPREIKFDDDLYSLEDSYKSQEEKLWYTLAAGVKSVLRTKPNQPSVFLMLFDSDKAGNTAKCLAKDVSKLATEYLMMTIKEPVMISGVDLQSKELLDESGLLLVSLNKTVREKGVLIVTDLQEVPAEVAKSFHFVCDRYSPLIEKAVYFFTLKVDSFSSLQPQIIAHQRLEKLWSDKLAHNLLQPLITRMTSNVLRIRSDFSNC